jgi:hypothetical protein
MKVERSKIAMAIGAGLGHLDGADVIQVTLSEHNLRTLLYRYEQSADQFTNPSSSISRLTENGVLLSVWVETDKQHYSDRLDRLKEILDETSPFPPQETNEP